MNGEEEVPRDPLTFCRGCEFLVWFVFLLRLLLESVLISIVKTRPPLPVTSAMDWLPAPGPPPSSSAGAATAPLLMGLEGLPSPLWHLRLALLALIEPLPVGWVSAVLCSTGDWGWVPASCPPSSSVVSGDWT